MLPQFFKRVFDIRQGEFKVSLWMLTYIFLIISTLLIVKPTVNALFLSELGIESLPFAFLMVAAVAILSSHFYSKALQRFSLQKVIESTLLISIILLVGLGVLLSLNIINVYILYFFYVWVAIYAVLSASQFWVLANLVFNVREAKRLFGFIGSGAILGGIFGGYLASILAPIIGVEALVFIAAFFLLLCIPLLRKIWIKRVEKLNPFKQKKRTIFKTERPFALIKRSKHLLYISCIVAVSVVVAKLVDYLFSAFASSAISDPDELASFFAFWFSTFNLLSLIVQLFITKRMVGVWGVGMSLLILPVGILLASSVFFVFPELALIIVIKAMDGSLKQSLNKSAIELLSLPLPFELKNKTKSFIDVVVDSIATGIAGFILIFVIEGLELDAIYITGIIVILVGIWIYFVTKVRTEYFRTFRNNLQIVTHTNDKEKRVEPSKASILKGMKTVFDDGTEPQILFMLKKLQEINDKRFESDVQKLLKHTSDKVKLAAIQNLYFLNTTTIATEVTELLNSDNEELIVAALEYLLLHSNKNTSIVYDYYLDNENPIIANSALICLAKESRDNYTLKTNYNLTQRIQTKIDALKIDTPTDYNVIVILKVIGHSNLKQFHPFILKYFNSDKKQLVHTAIEASGWTINEDFIPEILKKLSEKSHRQTAVEALHHFGRQILPVLSENLIKRDTTLAFHKYLPLVFRQFHSQESVRSLMGLLKDQDFSVRLEIINALSYLREIGPHLKFNAHKVVAIILEECKLYHQTLSAMHTQIIISYRNRKKSKELISSEEREARSSLLDLLERRLDCGLERIFKLLGLRYQQQDIDIVYTGLLSEKQEAQQNAIEFLDNLMSGNLKHTLLPLIENSVMDVTSEDIIQKIQHKIPTELECFKLLLNGNDLKIKLAVLYLITQQNDVKYLPLVESLTTHPDIKVKTFAMAAYEVIMAKSN